MKKIILKSKRITLRPVKFSDAGSFFKWVSDDEVIRYITMGRVKKLVDEKKFVKKVMKEKRGYFFSIVNENGLLIGNTQLDLDEKNKKVMFGLMIGEKNEWGKGYGTEVTKLLAKFVFEKLKHNRFELEVYKENKGAIKVYKKVGFKMEGLRRESTVSPVTKKYADLFMMGILKKEWRNKK